MTASERDSLWSKSLTVVIPSYQRRDQLQRLLGALGTELESDPAVARGVDVLVVLDGSSDGSLEAVSDMAFPVRLEACWQPNRGRSAVRNAGLAHACGDVVWFVDDDVVPTPGLVERHRRFHEVHENAVLMGPCVVPPEADTVGPETGNDALYRKLSRRRLVTHYADFRVNNTSAPAHVFRDSGGFDEGFSGWGCEDEELGLRILERGVAVHFDPQAVVWHLQRRTVAELRRNSIDVGRNKVYLEALHPEAATRQRGGELPGPPAVRAAAAWGLRRLGRGRAPTLRGISRLAASAASVEQGLFQGRVTSMLELTRVTSLMTGIAEADPTGVALSRRLHPPVGATSGAPEEAGIDAPAEREDDAPSSK